MKKIAKIGALLLAGILAGGMSSCSDMYPGGGSPVPEIQEVYTISVMVTNRQGEGLPEATVTIGGPVSASKTTDANGFVSFTTDVKPGTYELNASKDGYLPKSNSLTINSSNDGVNAVWNVMLMSEASQVKVEYNPTVGAEVNTDSETLNGNEVATVGIDVNAPAGAIKSDQGNVYIYITPIYSEEEAEENARGGDDKIMLIGATVSCSDPNAEIVSPIDVTFNVGAKAAETVDVRKYDDNDNFADYDNTTASDGKVTVKVDEFTSYGLFADVTFSDRVTTKAITFSPSDDFNNLNGTASIDLGSVYYNYGVGVNINKNAGNNQYKGLLIEALAMRYGANGISNAKGEYPLDCVLGVGARLTIFGEQDIHNLSARSLGEEATGEGYGDVRIEITTTTSADHNGGSN